jgi:hypothetical protein
MPVLRRGGNVGKALTIGIGIFLLSGCCMGVKNAMNAYARAVQEQTQVGQELLKRCETGHDQAACVAVAGVLTAIETSARELHH